MTGARKRARSHSGELDSDGDGDYDDENPTNLDDNGSHPNRSGGKRNSNSQSSRRDQNRIAQREFRLRKQQRIRDLEAHVQVLSESKDETFIQMREMLRALLKENTTLRKLVRNLSDFIGEDAAGGVLPSLGWSLKEFEDFMDKASTDVAFEALMRRRKAKEESQLPNAGQDRPQQPNQSQSQSQNNQTQYGCSLPNPILIRKNLSSSTGAVPSDSFDYSCPTLAMLAGTGPSDLSNGLHHTPLNMAFLDGSQLNFTPPPTTNNHENNFSSYPPRPVPVPPPSSSLHHTTTAKTTTNSLPDVSFPPDEMNDVINHVFGAPKVQDACELISYHLNNFRRNSAYCLPSSLRPTLIQRTVDHDSIIDEIPHPEIRNRMILMKGHFDLIDCITKYFRYSEIHGDDVLAHSNWEIHDTWLNEFGFLVDPTTLAIVNRWRKERNEREITPTEIYSSEAITGI